MGIHTAVLERAAANPFANRHTSSSSFPVKAYAELASRLSMNGARVIAFASVNRGEGVTRTVRGLAAEFTRQGKKVTTIDPADTPAPVLGAPWRSESPVWERKVITEESEIVLFDCGALEAGMEVLRLASLVDGVVLVVESNRTRKEQLQRALQLIQQAKGKLLGCVLNKRRYPVPAWLYRIL